MAKKIKWSPRAQKERNEILEYWVNRNKSKSYSSKLNQLFLDHIELIADMPELGISTNATNVRITIIRDYSVYYRIVTPYIEVLAIWDRRRDPSKFKL